MEKELLSKIIVYIAILFVSSSFVFNQDLFSYYIPKGKLTSERKEELKERIDSAYSKLSKEQRMDYKLNFVLFVVKKAEKCDQFLKNRVKKVSSFLSYHYGIDIEKEIEVVSSDKFEDKTSEGIYVTIMLVNR